jgi:hypothetical protein
MKKKYLKPEQSVLEMDPGTLLVSSLWSNLENEEIFDDDIDDAPTGEEEFWGR